MDREFVLKRSQDLCSFLDKGVSTYHVIRNVREILIKEGYKEFSYGEAWSSVEGKGFVVFNNSSLFAFDLNKDRIKEGIKFISSHIDSPSLKIKQGSDVIVNNGELYLNVEVYGGPILNTWLDRDLSIAGRVFIKDSDGVKEELIDFEEPIAFILNCPIHLNREINSGFSLNRQKHMLPIVLTNTMGGSLSLEDMISNHINVDKEDILDFDLYLYDTQKASICGVNKEFIRSKRIDDLAMGEASLYAYLNSGSESNKFICLFDGEEIGSSIPEGAYSMTLSNILGRIYDSMGVTKEDKMISIYNSFMISADMAHAYNGNYKEKFDEHNTCLINRGITIKHNSNKNYMTTGETSSYIKSLCNRGNIPYQVYYNRSDIPGGSTLGPIVTKYLSIKGVDLGNPMFAMHSCRECAGVLDHYYMSKLFLEYFK